MPQLMNVNTFEIIYEGTVQDCANFIYKKDHSRNYVILKDDGTIINISKTNLVRAYIYHFKKNSSCKNCGGKENLTFHHLYNKKGKVRDISGKSLSKVIEEISKCVILCRDCHDVVHDQIPWEKRNAR